MKCACHKIVSQSYILLTSTNCLHIVVATHLVCWGLVTLSICKDGLGDFYLFIFYEKYAVLSSLDHCHDLISTNTDSANKSKN